MIGEALVVRVPGAEPAEWEPALRGAEVVTLPDPPSAAATEAIRRSACAFCDGTDEPIPIARGLRRLDPTLQVVLVAPPDDHADLRKKMMFAPGLGEIWLARPEEVGEALVARAAEVTRQRRSFSRTRSRVEHDLALLEPNPARRAVISETYLAALLSVIPDPILSIDEDRKILSWNPAADRVLGYSRADALERPLEDLLRPERPEELERILTMGHARSASGEVTFFRADGSEGIGELSVIPVEAAGRRVRAVVLHDVTEQRRVQAELESSAVELEAQAAELQATQVELEISNDELQQANQQLAARTRETELALAEAESANRAKSQFLANMSHELRTPINAIFGYVDLLAMGVAGPVTEEQQAHLRRVKISGEHLLGLVTDILDFAKIESGQIQVRAQPVAAADVAQEALTLLSTQAAARGLTLEGPAADEVAVLGDRDRIRQILVNLLSNAVKFTRPGGRVALEHQLVSGAAPVGRRDGGWVRFDVTDTGIGIDPGQLEQVFEPFYQVDSGYTREEPGTGLGLTISQRLAVLMGGGITVESQPGEGSCFTLWLPASPTEPG